MRITRMLEDIRDSLGELVRQQFMVNNRLERIARQTKPRACGPEPEKSPCDYLPHGCECPLKMAKESS